MGNKETDTVKATFEKGQVLIDVNSPVPGGMRDYTYVKRKSITASPLDMVEMSYDGREIRVPALLLLNSWTNSAATLEGLFYNYYKEDLDWSSLGEEEKDTYFAEFVAHYMGQALFSELAENPLGLGVSAIAGILLAHFAAVPAAVMALVGTGMAGANIHAGSKMLTAALEKKSNATNMHEHKQAARLFAESVTKIGVNVLTLVVSLVQTGKAVHRGLEIRVGEVTEPLPRKKPETRVSVGSGDGTPILNGQWKTVNESMSDFSRVYQKQITGQEGMSWIQNGVKFDGMKDGVLLDAKGKYAQFINKNTGEFYGWFIGKESLLDEATRQIKASEGTKIQWYFAEKETCDVVQDLFMDKGITEIELIFQAPK